MIVETAHDQISRLVALVDEMLDLQRRHAAIDRLVYDLYGLTKDEIAIVEGRSRSLS